MKHIMDIFRENGRILFVTPNHEDNNAAIEILGNIGPFDTVMCPPSVVDLYSEDENPGRRMMIDKANKLLSNL